MNALPVFYTPKLVADSGSISPSAAKPAQVMSSWRALGISLDVHAPRAATAAELALAHDARYVDDVLECRRPNGFGNRSPQVAAALPFTTGAMLAAARHALETGAVAIAPVSGFHHAAWKRAAGFCTFNGLMVTAAVLRRAGARRIGILDCDHHYGDGTDQIIDHLDARAWVHHFTAGAAHHHPNHAPRFFASLPEVLDGFAGCDLVLYQAGADPHLDDPFGGWLTTAQLAERDAIVFEHLHRQGTPVAWNLAGGYQRDASGGIRPVLDIHDHTLRACAAVYLQPGAQARRTG